jgi:hypothetical protein
MQRTDDRCRKGQTLKKAVSTFSAIWVLSSVLSFLSSAFADEFYNPGMMLSSRCSPMLQVVYRGFDDPIFVPNPSLKQTKIKPSLLSYRSTCPGKSGQFHTA